MCFAPVGRGLLAFLVETLLVSRRRSPTGQRQGWGCWDTDISPLPKARSPGRGWSFGGWGQYGQRTYRCHGGTAFLPTCHTVFAHGCRNGRRPGLHFPMTRPGTSVAACTKQSFVVFSGCSIIHLHQELNACAFLFACRLSEAHLM